MPHYPWFCNFPHNAPTIVAQVTGLSDIRFASYVLTDNSLSYVSFDTVRGTVAA
jgi:hypothetical protein